jgi:hypothetical protein
MNPFEVPIVLFIYKRLDTSLAIIDRIRTTKAKKVYLIGDAGKSASDDAIIKKNRELIEASIDWDCEIVKNYADTNRGVYENIGLGAKWVFEREPVAIFLEDDNLPETTFFEYCKNLLDKYQDDTRVLWICGTNYLGKYEPADGSSYMFTKHLLPCGWASWANKFLEFYDFTFNLFNPVNVARVKQLYDNKKLFCQQKRSWEMEVSRKNAELHYISWDFHMSWSLRVNDLWGISPKYNQIKNIGVDEFSQHGGTSFRCTMTKRFCGMDSFALPEELIHPGALLPDISYEKMIGHMILFPLGLRIKLSIGRILRFIFRIPNTISIKEHCNIIIRNNISPKATPRLGGGGGRKSV